MCVLAYVDIVRLLMSNLSLSPTLSGVMKVNDADMSTVTHDQAIRILKTSPDPLSLLVRHEPSPLGLQVPCDPVCVVCVPVCGACAEHVPPRSGTPLYFLLRSSMYIWTIQSLLKYTCTTTHLNNHMNAYAQWTNTINAP